MATRIVFCILLAAALLGSPGPALAQERAAPALARFELPFDVQAEFDGAGGVRVLHDGVVVLDVELLFAGGFLDDPASVKPHALAAGDGQTVVVSPAAAARVLHEGIEGGLRGSASDDDGDGSLDEDPVDGLDNDGDGRIDEDFAAIGSAMHASRARIVSLPGVSARGEIFHWGYYNVDGALFWMTQLENEPSSSHALTGSPSAYLRTRLDVEMLDRTIRPHLSVGRAPEVRLTFPRLQLALDDGSTLHVGLLRLDGRRAAMLPGESLHAPAGVVWDAGSATTWPLALLVAKTEESLLFLAGQAMLTFEREGPAGSASQRWTLPPLCAHCRDPEIASAGLELSAHDELLRVSFSCEGFAEPEMIDHEGLVLGGIPMARWLEFSDVERATYELPLHSAPARRLVELGRGGGLDPKVWIASGRSVSPRRTDVQLSRELEAVGEEVLLASEEELPSYLSPRLVQSWPNPFLESTTIEVQVPATIEEAFDLEPSLSSRIDLKAAPPFGAQPTVQVRVYNVGGQLIRALDESVRGPGSFSVTWDGNDLAGRAVAAGAYYVNVEMGEWSVTRRVLRLKP